MFAGRGDAGAVFAAIVGLAEVVVEGAGGAGSRNGAIGGVAGVKGEACTTVVAGGDFAAVSLGLTETGAGVVAIVVFDSETVPGFAATAFSGADFARSLALEIEALMAPNPPRR
jgi:hypothetical protein